MFEFVRYTILVLVGLASIITLFISLAITGALIVQTSDLPVQNTNYATFWTLGLTALMACAWLSNNFVRRVPVTIFKWLQANKDQITAYCVISVIFFVFVVS